MLPSIGISSTTYLNASVSVSNFLNRAWDDKSAKKKVVIIVWTGSRRTFSLWKRIEWIKYSAMSKFAWLFFVVCILSNYTITKPASRWLWYQYLQILIKCIHQLLLISNLTYKLMWKFLQIMFVVCSSGSSGRNYDQGVGCLAV